MKKLILKTIWLIILLLASFLFVQPSASAKVLKDCKVDQLILDLGLDTDKDAKKGKFQTDFDKDFKEAKNDNTKSNNLVIRLAFEKARTKYHDTVKCVFDHATIALLGSASNVSEDINMSNPPDLTNMLGDLLKPDLACLKEDKLAKIIKDSSSENTLQPLLDAYQKYAEYIKHLVELSALNPDLDDSTIGSFEKLFANYESFKLIAENEIQDSIVALDTAFIALKEMRQAFVMHVHFQCMLKNLEVYRRVLANIRSVVTVLPGLIEDASMHK